MKRRTRVTNSIGNALLVSTTTRPKQHNVSNYVAYFDCIDESSALHFAHIFTVSLFVLIIVIIIYKIKQMSKSCKERNSSLIFFSFASTIIVLTQPVNPYSLLIFSIHLFKNKKKTLHNKAEKNSSALSFVRELHNFLTVFFSTAGSLCLDLQENCSLVLHWGSNLDITKNCSLWRSAHCEMCKN